MKKIKLLMTGKRTGPVHWPHLFPVTSVMAVSVALMFIISGCNKNTEQNAMDLSVSGKPVDPNLVLHPKPVGNVEEVKLVSDAPGLGAARTDPNLVNVWGIDMSGEEIGIAGNGTGRVLIYGENGLQLHAPVIIPVSTEAGASSPSGLVFNNTPGFVMPTTKTPDILERSKYLVSNEDGIISAINYGDGLGVTVVDRTSTGAVYKGIAIAYGPDPNGAAATEYLYATDFHNGKIDMFDRSFNYVRSFSDSKMPSDFAPFGIKNIDGMLYVTYAMQKPDKHDDQAGPGNGYVDIFSPGGVLLSRFASRGALNSPWGLAVTETQGLKEYVLVGNFGDGRITVFDMKGNFIGQVAEHGQLLTINGLWGLSFDAGGEREFMHEGTGRLYFTSGPGAESHGLFGYIQKAPSVTPTTATIVTPPSSLISHK